MLSIPVASDDLHGSLPGGAREPGLGYGEQLTSDTLSLPNGPMAGQVAGGLTRWMAIPWQTETARCRSGYQVLSHQNYDIVVDQSRPLPADRIDLTGIEKVHRFPHGLRRP